MGTATVSPILPFGISTPLGALQCVALAPLMFYDSRCLQMDCGRDHDMEWRVVSLREGRLPYCLRNQDTGASPATLAAFMMAQTAYSCTTLSDAFVLRTII